MKFMIKWGLLLIPALALAMPALAANDPRLSDSQEPGSVIVFPKFIRNGTVTTFGDGAVLPRTEIEIGVVCPPGVTPTTTQCFEHQTIKLKFHWVCPGSDNINDKYICHETDFNVFVSLNGKLAFSADGIPINSNSPRVPAAPCANGYLIGWVVDNSDRPIKFDGLIGDAVLRGPNIAAAGFTSTAVSAYSGITIQAHPDLMTGQLITLGSQGALVFDGGVGHYQAITGNLFGDVKFDNRTARAATSIPTPGNALSETWLILLTLDVRSNRPNFPTFVDLDFWNESLATVSTSNPLWEANTSTGVHFICWGQFRLSDIDSNLTQVFQGSRKGIFATRNVAKEAIAGVTDEDGPVTLLGLVQVLEGTIPSAFMERSYIFNTYNDSRRVDTRFHP